MTFRDFCKGLADAALLSLLAGVCIGILVITLALSAVCSNWIYYSLTDKPITTRTININVVPEKSIQPIDE